MGQAEPTTTAALLRRLALPAVFVAIVVTTQLVRQAPVAPSQSVTTELTGPTMGTSFMVKVRGPELDPAGAAELSAAVQGALGAVNESMSTWLPTSELSRFNDGPAATPFALSGPTMEVLAIAQDVYRRSGGAFDVTVGPLVNRWGFGPQDRQEPPDDAEIAALLGAVGQDKLVIDASVGTVSKPDAGLRVDLSAVAKGYAVDQVALAIEALGHLAYMVEVGGEVRTGTAGDGAPWRIAVEAPSAPGDLGEREVFEVLELSGRSMATSGDYRNFIVDGDDLRSHTIDPRTGSPVTHRLASVTVVHEQCGVADAWATALMVMGPEQGLALAREQGLAAMFLTRQGDALKRSTTAEMDLLSVGTRLDEPGQGAP